MSTVTDEQIEAFRAAWLHADEEGLTGNRVRAGLEAVFGSTERVCDERDQYREALVDANRQLELARRRVMDADTILDELSRHEFTDHGELTGSPMHYRMWVTCRPCGWSADMLITSSALERKAARDAHLAAAIVGRVQ